MTNKDIESAKDVAGCTRKVDCAAMMHWTGCLRLNPAKDDRISRRGVVERLREVADGYKQSAGLGAMSMPEVNAGRYFVAEVLNALAEEFTAEGKEDQVEMKQTAPSHSTVVDQSHLQLRVAEIRERRKKITPGQWEAYTNGTTVAVYRDGDTHNDIIGWPGFDGLDLPPSQVKSNARFIANAPTDIDTLLQIIDSLTVVPTTAQSRADWHHLDDGCPGHYDNDEGHDCPAIADIASSITQDSASASELSEQLPDASSCPHLHYGFCVECGAEDKKTPSPFEFQ